MKIHFTYPSADGRTLIHAIRWIPDNQKPVGILQIAHGMVEFIDRYDEFARFLNRKGYVVVGNDHLGHGGSVVSHHDLGHFGEVAGYKVLISDMHTLRHRTRSDYPDLPYFMLGHSMGSFLVRQYITEQDAEYAKGLSGVVVMGTGWTPNAVSGIAKTLAKLLGTDKVGKTAETIDKMAFGAYLKKIDNPRTVSDWLTKDTEIVDQYRANPWNTFHFTPNAYYHMFAGMQKAHDISRMKKLPAGLPLLFTSGAEDPVGNWGEGVRKAFMVYTENTECKVDIRLYDNDRHEILNETDRANVFADLLAFFEHCLGEYQETFGVVPMDSVYESK
jgi:alpha-beta hydrolase superfamily lysophospholipase